MSQIVISTTDDPNAWDNDNSVTINVIYSYIYANTWSYSSGNMSIIGTNVGVWPSPGVGDTIIPFQNNSSGLVFSLGRTSAFPRFNSFASLPANTQGIAMGTNPDNTTWTLIAP
jgi:hypothetical protein